LSTNIFIILLLISFENKMSSKTTVNVSNSQSESIDEAIVYLIEIIENLINNEKKSFVTIGLTGGSLIKLLSNGIGKHTEHFLKYSSKLKFIFGDERFMKDYEERIKQLLNSNNGFDVLILGHGNY
jgi:6-phosphogluconolactonase/glucosamine-6-phosphate isomerase/deaminase